MFRYPKGPIDDLNRPPSQSASPPFHCPTALPSRTDSFPLQLGLPPASTRISFLAFARIPAGPSARNGPAMLASHFSPEGLQYAVNHRFGRRALLQLGLAGSLGLGPLAHSALANAGAAPRAKRCILLFMWGGPSHLDTFDMKPHAPNDFRGPFQPIATSAPEIQFCEHFSKLATQAHHLAVIRSLTHDDPAHLSSAHTLMTGQLPPVNKSDAQPPSEKDSPHLGSLLDKLRGPQAALLPFVSLPWHVSHPAAPGGMAPGQNAGWLGRKYDPFMVAGDLNDPAWNIPALSTNSATSADRFASRKQLLESLTQFSPANSIEHQLPDFDAQQTRAFDLLMSTKVRNAFQIEAEPVETRDRYGRNPHGQSVLLARRLIEHDVPMVAVNFHNDGQNFWDTHGNNFNRLQHALIPMADQALAALLADLHERGLLDETLVMWVGEFGRSPRITNGTGRDHHPGCYSGLMAGAGIRGGQVYGKSDRFGIAPSESPVSPHDFTATALYAHGIPQDAALYDQLNRPRPVYAGTPIKALFG